MADTMTAWEKQWMEEAPQDCLRTFVLNPTAPGGYSEYGETMLDFDSTETLTEDSGKAEVSLLKVDAPAPLKSGTFLRMYLFGSISNGVPVWQTEPNGEPKNYRNYYVKTSNSRWFERHPTGHVDRFKHEYSCCEVLECLKDYPIRSVKTFAEGAYTFKECLQIAFALAFRPRSVGNYSFDIKDFAGLDEPNSKLEYPNSTLYDVVTDIGRIIDGVPSMEIVFSGGVYTFELRFIDRYGLEGEVHDISYFNMKVNDAVNTERDTSAGTSISNVQNMIVGGQETESVAPNTTNLSNAWNIYQVPYPIDEVTEIRFSWEQELIRRYETDTSPLDWRTVNLKTTGEQVELHWFGQFVGFKTTGILTDRKTILTKDNFITVYTGGGGQLLPPSGEGRIFLRPDSEYIYLPKSGSSNVPCQDNTIHYSKGSNEVDISCIINKTLLWFEVEKGEYGVFRFSTNPTSSLEVSPKKNYHDLPWFVSITYKAMLNGCIKGANSKPSDITCFFNQQGQVVSIQSFGSAVNNYTKTMFGENRVLAHMYDRIGRKEMYAEMPKVGSSVIDKERGKRYVVTLTSFTRKMNGGLFLATLAESRAGKSRRIIADNRQRCYAIPSESVVDSMSHTHIRCKMGVQSAFATTATLPDFAFDKRYMFNAFIGKPYNSSLKPRTAALSISTNSGTLNRNIGVFLSRLRLSVVLSFRAISNSAFRTKDGEPELYVDSNGQLKGIWFNYRAGDTSVVLFYQEIYKDSYEILNHTTQVSWVEYGNLQIGESLIDMSYFGNGDGLDQPLQIALLSSRMRINDTLSPHIAARYNVNVTDNGNAFTFTVSGMSSIPKHVGWAIVRGDKLILLDNFDVLTDNTVKVYYDVEVRD